MSTLLYSAELWPLSVTQKKKIGSNPSQVSATTIGYILEGQSTKRSGQATDKIGRIEPHHQGEKTEMAGTCTMHGR